MLRQHDLEGLLKLLQFSKKAELVRYSKVLEIHSSDFANMILAAEAGLMPYFHQISQREFRPDHLELTRKDLDAFGKSPLEGDALKTVNKVKQLFKTRRYLVGHMFYTPDSLFWHFFYFDQRDTSNHSNHWKGGSHIHFLNFLWPRRTVSSVWNEFNMGNPNMKGAIHIRYIDDSSKPHREQFTTAKERKE